MYPARRAWPEPHRWTITAQQQEDVLGQLTLSRPARGVAELRWVLASRPGEGGRGIARAVLSAALNECRQAGASRVVLHVPVRGSNNDEDHDAARMYDALGFTEIDRLAYFTRPSPHSNQESDSRITRTLTTRPADAYDDDPAQ